MFEHMQCLLRIEIANGRARIKQLASALRHVWRQMPVGSEVRGNGPCRHLRKVLPQPYNGLLQKLHRNIHAHKLQWCHTAAQTPHLLAIASTQLDQHLAATHGLGHFDFVLRHDRRLGARGVILAQLRNLFKQGTAARVVQKLGRDLCLLLHQALRKLVSQRRLSALGTLRGGTDIVIPALARRRNL